MLLLLPLGVVLNNNILATQKLTSEESTDNRIEVLEIILGSKNTMILHQTHIVEPFYDS